MPTADERLLRGFEVGQRAYERYGLMRERKARGKREKELHEQTMEHAAAGEERLAQEHEWEEADRKTKEGYEKAERGYLLAKRLYKSGDLFGAASILTDTYNRHIPDGNEVMIITPQSQPEYFQQLLESGQVPQEHADAQAILMSKDHGTIPFTNFDELMRLVEEDFNQENYFESVRKGRQKIADLNSSSFREPYQTEGGDWAVVENYMDEGNIIRQRVVPHDPSKHGALPISERNKMIRGLGWDPYNLTEDQEKMLAESTRVGLGLPTTAQEKRERTEDFRKSVLFGLDVMLKAQPQKRYRLSEKERADLYVKAEKAYRESFEDPIGNIKKDAPDKKQWIIDYMADAIGAQKKTEPGPKTVVNESAVTDDKGQIVKRKVVYSDGSQEIIDAQGNVIAKKGAAVRGLIPRR